MPSPTDVSNPLGSVALVLFTDIRGFSRWSEDPEVFANLDTFVPAFLHLVHRHFQGPATLIKNLGDGAMIVRDLSPAEGPREILGQTLGTIAQCEEGFARLCETFAHSIGHPADLKLGWGIVRGKVRKLESGDYVGPNVNKSAKLCELAHPFGIVIDRADFPEVPEPRAVELFPQTRILTGIGEVGVWVTKAIASPFVVREQLRQTPEVHVAGQCIDTRGKRGLRVLLARRSASRKLYPGLIEGCGGQLALSETFAEGVRRHFRLEMGIDVQVIEAVHCFYEIRVPNEPVIPGIRFLCERVGDAEPRSDNHSQVWWVSETEFRKMPAGDFIPGLKEQVLALLDRFKKER